MPRLYLLLSKPERGKAHNQDMVADTMLSLSLSEPSCPKKDPVGHVTA